MSPQYPEVPDPRDAWINSAMSISATVVLYYDYFLTLPREILFLWPPHNKIGWYTSTCLLNRYLPILGTIPIVVPYLIPVDLDGLHIYHEWLVMAMQTLAGIICLIRVYALYGRSRRILIFLLILGSGVTINGCVQMSAGHRTEGKIIPGIPSSSLVGCYQFTSAQGGKSLALAWMGVLLFDCAIFTLTLYKAFTMGSGIWLLHVIVRDGAMYFSALFIINLANIFILLYTPPLIRSATATSTNVLSITLVSRLILNLREQNAVLVGLPMTMESIGKFQAGLPITSVKDPSISVVRATSTIGTVGCLADRETRMIPVGPGQDNAGIVKEMDIMIR